MKYIEERREKTRERLNLLQSELGVLENILGDKACVYSTGSFGRLEAGSNSDLDLFIVTKTSKLTDGEVETIVNQLSQLDTILVKAGLISAVRKLKIPDFDADGRYLACHSVEDFLSSLGGPDDDYKNTLTGRLLLFLEGRPLVGEKVHSEVIDEVIAAYFEDFADRSEEFVPAYLANDILRLWRTFCVNYEFGRKSKRTASKIKNYKLKHSRMLTCYSALIYLLAIFRSKGTVSVMDSKNMAALTPTERLEWVLNQSEFEEVHLQIEELLVTYSNFLRRTELPKSELISRFEEKGREWTKESYDFGDLISEVLVKLGRDTKMLRLLLV